RRSGAALVCFYSGYRRPTWRSASATGYSSAAYRAVAGGAVLRSEPSGYVGDGDVLTVVSGLRMFPPNQITVGNEYSPHSKELWQRSDLGNAPDCADEYRRYDSAIKRGSRDTTDPYVSVCPKSLRHPDASRGVRFT